MTRDPETRPDPEAPKPWMVDRTKAPPRAATRALTREPSNLSAVRSLRPLWPLWPLAPRRANNIRIAGFPGHGGRPRFAGDQLETMRKRAQGAQPDARGETAQ